MTYVCNLLAHCCCIQPVKGVIIGGAYTYMYMYCATIGKYCRSCTYVYIYMYTYACICIHTHSTEQGTEVGPDLPPNLVQTDHILLPSTAWSLSTDIITHIHKHCTYSTDQMQGIRQTAFAFSCKRVCLLV